ncbi:hypothetical protein ABEG17_15050 [Pedococcus sp. KACC 23699]|uniref:Sigma-70 family RNA polymerase sigma factor n=1 Tax=Pedococcus sp. KACC 23699 TaxID=3149228 RepID=A0AAU7JRK1_9MICO
MLGSAFTTTLREAQAGDEQAFTRLWRDANPLVVRYLRVIGADDAYEAASEGWVTAVRGLPGFTGDESAWRVWLLACARLRAEQGTQRQRWATVIPIDRRSASTSTSGTSTSGTSTSAASSSTTSSGATSASAVASAAAAAAAAALAATAATMTGRGRDDEAELTALLGSTGGTRQERCGLSDTIAALRALPLGQGEILMLRLGAGLPVRAVSDVVGSDDETVRRAQARALERLEVEGDLVAWSLGAPPTAAELADERVALAAYRHIPRPPAWAVPRTRVITVGRPPAGSRAGRRTALGIANAAGRSRTALLAISALSAAVMSLGGLSAAAYVGALPSGVQQVMHEAIGAPPPTVAPLRAKRTSQATPRRAPVTTTPPRGRPAAIAPASPASSSAPALPLTPRSSVTTLCRQWSAHRTAGAAGTSSTAFRDLSAAAGGADRVTLFCATATATATPTVTTNPVTPTSAPPTTTSSQPSPTQPSSPTQSPSAPSSPDTGVPVPAPTTQTTAPSPAPTTTAGGAPQGPASDAGSSPTGAPQPASTTDITPPPG